MRRHQDRHPARIGRTEQIHDLDRQHGIQVPGRLVGEQDERIMDQGAGDHRPLLFAPRQLRRQRRRPMLQADLREHPPDAPIALVPFDSDHLKRERDVFRHRRPWQQLEILENDPDFSPQGRHGGTSQLSDVAPVHQNLPMRWLVRAKDEVEQRGFTRAGRSGQEDEFAPTYRKAHIRKSGVIAREHSGNMEQLNHSEGSFLADFGPRRDLDVGVTKPVC